MYFFCKLIPPRPSFPADITPVEAETMRQHAAYWRSLLESGKVIAFGPVADPAGSWGVGLVSVLNEAELAALQNGDPAIQAAIGMRYEAYPMPKLVHTGYQNGPTGEEQGDRISP
jgi:hypothetical protein